MPKMPEITVVRREGMAKNGWGCDGGGPAPGTGGDSCEGSLLQAGL